MKKLLFLLCLLPMLASVGFGQESRQDVSASFIGTYQPTIIGNANTQTSTFGKGVLLSYRFMLTPSSAIEGNYSYSQLNMAYNSAGHNYARATVHTSMQEGSAAYVRSFVYKKFNPFAEAGGGILLFRPIDDTGTSTNAASTTKAIAGLFGGGIAYELSPSWDLRVQYRGFILKSVDFGLGGPYATDRYYLMQQPTVGVAYHF